MSWSSGAEELYGYGPDEVLGEPISLLAPESDGDEPMRPAAAAQVGQRFDEPNAVHRHKDGGELAVSLTVAPIPNDAGEPTGAIVVTRDIGETAARRRATARARPSTAPSPSSCRRSRTSIRSVSGGHRST